MKLSFPSSAFDDAVSAVCHGSASEEQVQALNVILRNDGSARDEYILRVELHARLASDRDLFASAAPASLNSGVLPENVIPGGASPIKRGRRLAWAFGLAAC